MGTPVKTPAIEQWHLPSPGFQEPLNLPSPEHW